MRRRSVANFCMVVGFVLCSLTGALAEPSVSQNHLVTLASQMRKDWEQIRDNTKGIPASHQAAMMDRLKQWSNDTIPDSDVSAYMQCRLEGRPDVSQQRLIAEEHLSEASIVMMPEWIVLSVEGIQCRSERAAGSRGLAELIPISIWAKEEDGLRSEVVALVDPPPPIVPIIKGDTMLRIAAELERAAEWNLAWRAYAEYVYCGYGPPFASDKAIQRETWLSDDVAIYWVKVAECARKAGRAELGSDYLLKAAVFGGEEASKEVEDLSVKWSAAAISETESEPVDREVRRDALTRAVRLYAEINAHPRALQLLDDYPESFEDVQKLREETEQQWIAVVKDASRGARKVTLYGTEVYPSGDPLKVRIPWAFSDEAILSVREESGSDLENRN